MLVYGEGIHHIQQLPYVYTFRDLNPRDKPPAEEHGVHLSSTGMPRACWDGRGGGGCRNYNTGVDEYTTPPGDIRRTISVIHPLRARHVAGYRADWFLSADEIEILIFSSLWADGSCDFFGRQSTHYSTSTCSAWPKHLPGTVLRT